MRTTTRDGETLVYTVTLTYTSEDVTQTRRFVDYTDAWNWARQEAAEYAAQTGDVEPKVNMDWNWEHLNDEDYE